MDHQGGDHNIDVQRNPLDKIPGIEDMNEHELGVTNYIWKT